MFLSRELEWPPVPSRCLTVFLHSKIVVFIQTIIYLIYIRLILSHTTRHKLLRIWLTNFLSCSTNQLFINFTHLSRNLILNSAPQIPISYHINFILQQTPLSDNILILNSEALHTKSSWCKVSNPNSNLSAQLRSLWMIYVITNKKN